MRDHRPNIARTGAKVRELLRVELDALVCQVADAVLINDAHRLLRALWPQHRIHSRCGLPGPVQQGQVWVLVVALVGEVLVDLLVLLTVLPFGDLNRRLARDRAPPPPQRCAAAKLTCA